MDKDKSIVSPKESERIEPEQKASYLRGSSGPCVEALAKMDKEGRKVHVIGHIRDGRLEIDQKAVDEMMRRFPDANMSFVAVNAPFDPVPHHGE
jgi:hypothetical protein